jgi:hypothetical protein
LKDVEVVLTDRLTTIAGSVRDARGSAATDGHIIAFATGRESWHAASRFIAHTTVSATGMFSLRGLPPGDYFVAAVDRVRGSDEDGEWADPGLLDALAARAAHLTLNEGESVSLTLPLLAR